ncbi:hypothetical protein BU23DRAFT_560423 [Bimuria novae-zelandiae CBS 107.79]|uniref:Uncharacterized protein n=1 Tax=Bimuria novae-zelandiae CBS 107.79 TaxID=1447943 RepID=A0A6A5UNL3_9PLEO|nr:hypothetical protein BU23DRAFT_560423 [Bimuria novae-zelandiae CBS 107.79]
MAINSEVCARAQPFQPSSLAPHPLSYGQCQGLPPIALGGISIGNAYSSLFGESEDAFELLDAFYSLGGNFISTRRIYITQKRARS